MISPESTLPLCVYVPSLNHRLYGNCSGINRESVDERGERHSDEFELHKIDIN
jgi:hypothetical protein